MTEAGKICCETQTDHVNPQNALTCYTGVTDENTGDIIDYGDLDQSFHNMFVCLTF